MIGSKVEIALIITGRQLPRRTASICRNAYLAIEMVPCLVSVMANGVEWVIPQLKNPFEVWTGYAKRHDGQDRRYHPAPGNRQTVPYRTQKDQPGPGGVDGGLDYLHSLLFGMSRAPSLPMPTRRCWTMAPFPGNARWCFLRHHREARSSHEATPTESANIPKRNLCTPRHTTAMKPQEDSGVGYRAWYEEAKTAAIEQRVSDARPDCGSDQGL